MCLYCYFEKLNKMKENKSRHAENRIPVNVKVPIISDWLNVTYTTASRVTIIFTKKTEADRAKGILEKLHSQYGFM